MLLRLQCFLRLRLPPLRNRLGRVVYHLSVLEQAQSMLDEYFLTIICTSINREHRVLITNDDIVPLSWDHGETASQKTSSD